eukprot:12748986-Alexandrium_andersonii.AAC.1
MGRELHMGRAAHRASGAQGAVARQPTHVSQRAGPERWQLEAVPSHGPRPPRAALVYVFNHEPPG